MKNQSINQIEMNQIDSMKLINNMNMKRGINMKKSIKLNEMKIEKEKFEDKNNISNEFKEKLKKLKKIKLNFFSKKEEIDSIEKEYEENGGIELFYRCILYKETADDFQFHIINSFLKYHAKNKLRSLIEIEIYLKEIFRIFEEYYEDINHHKTAMKYEIFNRLLYDEWNFSIPSMIDEKRIIN